MAQTCASNAARDAIGAPVSVATHIDSSLNNAAYIRWHDIFEALGPADQSSISSCIDLQLLGVVVPRQRRTGGCRPRAAWPSATVLENTTLDEIFHEDEREALEALCFLSAGSCQSQFTVDDGWDEQPGGGTYWSEPPQQSHAVKQGKHHQPRCQPSRQLSPASDTTSGGCQVARLSAMQYGAALAGDRQQSRHMQPMSLDDVHPAALPDARLFSQQLPAAAELQGPWAEFGTQQQQQEDAFMHWQLHVAGITAPSTAAAALISSGLQPTGANFAGPAAWGQGLLNPAAAPGAVATYAELSGQCADATTVAAAACDALGLGHTPLAERLAALLQPSAMPMPQPSGFSVQLAATIAAAAAAGSLGPRPSLPGVLELFVPGAMQSSSAGGRMRQLGSQLGMPGPCSAADSPVHVVGPPVKGCYWHVYIAKKIAAAQQLEEQQVQPTNANVQPAAADVAAGVHKGQVKRRNGSSQPLSPAAAQAVNPTKRQKSDQQPADGSQPGFSIVNVPFQQQQHQHQVVPLLPPVSGLSGTSVSLSASIAAAVELMACSGVSNQVLELAQSLLTAGASPAQKTVPGHKRTAGGILGSQADLQPSALPWQTGLATVASTTMNNRTSCCSDASLSTRHMSIAPPFSTTLPGPLPTLLPGTPGPACDDIKPPVGECVPPGFDKLLMQDIPAKVLLMRLLCSCYAQADSHAVPGLPIPGVVVPGIVLPALDGFSSQLMGQAATSLGVAGPGAAFASSKG